MAAESPNVASLRELTPAIEAAATPLPFAGRRRPWGAIFAAAWMLFLLGLTLGADLLPLSEGLDPSKTLSVPVNLAPGESGDHLLGTDGQGLDILSGVVHGARVAMVVGLGGTLLGLVAGGLLGMIAGYVGGVWNVVISFVVDVFLTFPALILLLALVTLVKPNPLSIAIVLGVLAFPNFARLARANTLAVVSRDFVAASQVLGASRTRILLRSVLPNLLPSLLALGFLMMSVLIVAEASLSFLGVGIQRPRPTWGNMIAQGFPKVEDFPTLVLAPTVMIFLTVLAANTLGQRLQRRWRV